MPRDHTRTRAQYWQWRYRDSTSGQLTETTIPLTEEEATQLAEAERIEGSMSSGEGDLDEFPETAPDIRSIATEEGRSGDPSSDT